MAEIRSCMSALSIVFNFWNHCTSRLTTNTTWLNNGNPKMSGSFEVFINFTFCSQIQNCSYIFNLNISYYVHSIKWTLEKVKFIYPLFFVVSGFQHYGRSYSGFINSSFNTQTSNWNRRRVKILMLLKNSFFNLVLPFTQEILSDFA